MDETLSRYIDPRIHVTSRTVDDYLAMRAAVAVVEPVCRPVDRRALFGGNSLLRGRSPDAARIAGDVSG